MRRIDRDPLDLNHRRRASRPRAQVGSLADDPAATGPARRLAALAAADLPRSSPRRRCPRPASAGPVVAGPKFEVFACASAPERAFPSQGDRRATARRVARSTAPWRSRSASRPLDSASGACPARGEPSAGSSDAASGPSQRSGSATSARVRRSGHPGSVAPRAPAATPERAQLLERRGNAPPRRPHEQVAESSSRPARAGRTRPSHPAFGKRGSGPVSAGEEPPVSSLDDASGGQQRLGFTLHGASCSCLPRCAV